MAAGFVQELEQLINRHVVAAARTSDSDNLELMAELLHEAGDKLVQVARRWQDETDHRPVLTMQ